MRNVLQKYVGRSQPGQSASPAVLSGAWILALGLLLSQGTLSLRFTPPVNRLIYHHSDYPSDFDDSLSRGERDRLADLSSARQFVRGSYVEGVLAAIGMTLSLTVSIVFWRRAPLYAWTNVWMTLLWSGGKSIFAWYIWRHSSNLFDPPNSTIPWSDFNGYISAYSRFNNRWMICFILLGFPAMAFMNRRFKKFGIEGD